MIAPVTPPQSTVLGLPIHLLDDYPSWPIAWLQHYRYVAIPGTDHTGNDRSTATERPAIAPPPVPRRGFHIVTLNAEMAMQAERNPRLAATIRQADLVIPDGSGVVLYLKLRGKSVQRCPGIELAEALLDYAGITGGTTGGTTGANSAEASPMGIPGDRPLRVWFYGGKPESIDRAADHWRSRCPGIQFAGVTHGYLNAEEQEQLLDELEREQPDLILLGLGVPRQEFWIAAHRDRCPQSVWIGVGGSFDIWSGSKARAPEWFCKHHLEWLYRLYQEPWRWRRMLDLPRFAGRAMLAWVRGQ
jgi:N-acetylglucosaminyldiphosphoundecaprenol N-acetyl-beta-D-mannosaminyltransferase